MQRPALSSLRPPDNCILYAIAGETRMESTEPKEPYTKPPEQPNKGGIEYQGF